MEAIWKIEVEDFPAFILVDDKGNDFFQQNPDLAVRSLREVTHAALRGGAGR
ncbi:fumarate hydratase C-terminal domain-containing protein [Klebsiella pneumoniae subsp. pneumoniae]|nr:fumarate hydratase C-terminal domain-containing protein [Klebsiella pneumoniae subsp. pneumoniae]